MSRPLPQAIEARVNVLETKHRKFVEHVQNNVQFKPAGGEKRPAGESSQAPALKQHRR